MAPLPRPPLLRGIPSGYDSLSDKMEELCSPMMLSHRHQFLVAAIERLLQWARQQKDLDSAKRNLSKISNYIAFAKLLM
jgi:hypothetical protein